MFWRFGLIEASRPVAALTCWNVVCRRPSSPIQFGQRVEVGLDELRELPEALDLGDDRVLVADRLQHARVGAEAGLAAALAREAELLEQDLGRAAAGEPITNSSPASSQISRSSWSASARMREATVSSLRGVELDARLLGLAQHVHERELDVGQQVGRARARASCGGAGGSASSWMSTARARLLVVGVDRHPALLGELVERVAAAGGVEQVGGDLGVEDEVARDVAERLGVVGDDGAVAGARRRARRGRRPRPRARGRRRRRRRSATAARAGSARPRATSGGDGDERELVAAEHARCPAAGPRGPATV